MRTFNNDSAETGKEHSAANAVTGHPMTTHESAARLRRIASGETPAYVYGIPNERCGNNGEIEFVLQMHSDDKRSVIAAYLAEHSADDEVPVDDGWLASIGIWNNDAAAYRVNRSRLVMWLRSNGQVWLDFDSMLGGSVGIYKRLKTRGDVRRLASALGIDLERKGGK